MMSPMRGCSEEFTSVMIKMPASGKAGTLVGTIIKTVSDQCTTMIDSQAIKLRSRRAIAKFSNAQKEHNAFSVGL